VIQFMNGLLNISLSILLLAALGVSGFAQGHDQHSEKGQPQGGKQIDHSADRGQDMQTIHAFMSSN
jgi:hypothetical protein